MQKIVNYKIIQNNTFFLIIKNEIFIKINYLILYHKKNSK